MWLDDFRDIVRKGSVIDLAHSLDAETPHHPAHAPFMYRMTKSHGDVVYEDGVTAANDMFTMGAHVGTHLDGLGHIAHCGMIHGGRRAEEYQSLLGGFREVGVETVEPVVCRGVLLDIAALKGMTVLEPTYEITVEDLESALTRQNLRLQPGDAVLLRTGWSTHLGKPRLFTGLLGSPGPGLPAAQWLVAQGMRITGSDTGGYECLPAHSLPVHVELLVRRGIHIMEALNLEELAQAAVGEFMFVCLPLKIRGGTGSPIRPVALC